MADKHRGLSRRDVLAAAGGLAVAGTVRSAAAKDKPPTRARVVRIAHLTDVHVQPELNAPEGLAACLRHVHVQADRPDIIFNGGDMIMDSLGTDWERTRRQWEVWKRVLKEHCPTRVVHCLGNHDVWGWDRKRSGCTGAEPLYGKKAALEQLELSERYRHFDLGGWRVFVLDSTHPVENGVYTARLDDGQYEWFAGALAATPRATPVLVLSHIPILSGCVFMDGENEKTGNWVVPGAWMHTDARRIKDLFVKHPNVKLAVSGHLHLRERLDYNNVTYLCNGAVSGAWWKGSYQETPPGYAMIDLYNDGTFENRYVTT